MSTVLYRVIQALLGLWALGLLCAAIALGAWRAELTHTLIQLNGDAQFRSRTVDRGAVDPEWYRRKALQLLATNERLDRDALWTTFIPGSWRWFDDLEERVRVRIAAEFGEIVVETMRRELLARGAALTGSAQPSALRRVRDDEHCAAPRAAPAWSPAADAVPGELPEFAALRAYVAEVETLDRAIQAWADLQRSAAGPGQLRALVAYTLNKDLPGEFLGNVRLFGTGEPGIESALMRAQLQGPARCTLFKGLEAVFTRLFEKNELLLAEERLAQASGVWIDLADRSAGPDVVPRLAALRQLLDAQHDLLRSGRHGWMRAGVPQLGAGYEALVARMGRTALLGTDVPGAIQAKAVASFLQFRQRLGSIGDPDDPGIVWDEATQRFELSPARIGTRAGLNALLSAQLVHVSRVDWSAAAQLVSERDALLAQGLVEFPPALQPTVTRWVDRRVAEHLYAAARADLEPVLRRLRKEAFDRMQFLVLRDRAESMQAVLTSVGAPGRGGHLVAMLDAELLRRLRPLHEAWLAELEIDPESSAALAAQGRFLQLAGLGGRALRHQPEVADWAQVRSDAIAVRRSAASLSRTPEAPLMH